MSIDPNFHFFIEELAVGDQKNTVAEVVDYLQHKITEASREESHYLTELVNRCQKHFKLHDIDDNKLLSIMILPYLKQNITQLDPSLLVYLDKIWGKCSESFSQLEKEEFQLYMRAAKIQKAASKRYPS